MGYAFVAGNCVGCGRFFTFNPRKVPSIKVDGVKEPVCKGCVEATQKKQREMGAQVWADPLPGAYEPCKEEEL